MKAKDLTNQINSKINELAQMVDEAEFSNEIQKYLDTVSKFHKYSFNNQWLIMMQCPTASHVAGYHSWIKNFGRHVNKGEKAIRILAPIFHEHEDDESGKKISQLVGFKVVSVFDIAQTSGRELKELNVWKTREKLPELETALMQYATELNLNVKIDNSRLGGAEGCLTSENEIYIKAEAGTKTLAHEIAHYLAGHLKGNKVSHKQRELEAEATAHTVCSFFGLNDSKAPNYLYLTGLKAEDLKNSLDTIAELAKKIITAIEKKI